MGMTLDFKNLKMSWDDCHVPMREFPSVLKPRKNDGCFGPEPTVAEQLYYDALEEDLEDDDTLPTCDTTECSEDDYFLNDEDEGNDQAVNCGGDDPKEEIDIDIGEAYVENPTKKSRHHAMKIRTLIRSVVRRLTCRRTNRTSFSTFCLSTLSFLTTSSASTLTDRSIWI
jgi:hypothetical protein